MNLAQLYQTLNLRKRPEDVAQMIVELWDKDLNSYERKVLNKAAKGALKNTFFRYTSMLQAFAEVVGAEKQIKTAIELFELKLDRTINYNQFEAIKLFIEEVSPLIFKSVGKNNFVSDRLNKEERKAHGLEISKRNYNKKWRLLKRLEKKLLKFERESKKLSFQKIAKHGIVHRLSFEAFRQDLNTACFVAYYTARCNLRSVFTNQSQTRAFDEISEMLLNRCKGIRMEEKSVLGLFKKKQVTDEKSASGENTNWLAIAHVYTSQAVLAALSDQEKGRLLGAWTNILKEIASLLGELWLSNDMDRSKMIVKKGNDSTTWNNTAGAWNKARDHWMNLIYALGMDYLLEEICFGKVLRLMAADVVAWHYRSGGQLDPNTEVWCKLPLPWEVFQEKASCTRALVEEQCRAVDLDPERSGWVAPKVHGVASFSPTPELVHGVAIANPYLAKVLKRHKYFSGKSGGTTLAPIDN